MKMLCAVCGTRGVLGRTDKCGPCHRAARVQSPARQRGRPVRDDLTPALEASVTILTRLTQLEIRVKALESKLVPTPPIAVWPSPIEKRTPRRLPDDPQITMTPHGPACMCLACRARGRT
jgi:hypothetical protein